MFTWRWISSCALALACGGNPPPKPAPVEPLACPQGSRWNGSLCERTEKTDPAPPPPPLVSHRVWSPPPLQPEDVPAARQHFMQAVRRYDQGDFQGALDEFETAYSFKPMDQVLYNIGQTLEGLGRDEEALDVFQRYQATNPPRTADVQKKIDALKRKLGRP